MDPRRTIQIVESASQIVGNLSLSLSFFYFFFSCNSFVKKKYIKRSWGLSINGYYGLLFAIVLILSIPILWLHELDASKIPLHSFSHFFREIWVTLQNLTTFYLIIFVIGTLALTNFNNNANIALQYYVIKLTNLQAGIDTITTYSGLVFAIYLFQKYLINENWRFTQYGSTIIAAVLGLIWIAPYHNSGGTQNAWFTIFIDLDTVGLFYYYYYYYFNI